MTDTPSPFADTLQFFGALFGSGDSVLFRPIETWDEDGRKQSRVDYKAVNHYRFGLQGKDNGTALWPKKVIDVMRCHTDRAKQTRANIFFGVCARFGNNQEFDLAWQIRVVRVLWADVDDCGPEEAVERCKAAGLPEPSIVVSSGNGAHLYWLLAEPYLIDDVGDPQPVHTKWVDLPSGKRKPVKFLKDPTTGEELSLGARQNVPRLSDKAQRAQDVLAGIAAKIGGDHTQDLSRLLRVPETLNRKDERNGREPVPCRLLKCEKNQRHPFVDFERFAELSPDRSRREQLAKAKLPTVRKLTANRTDRLNELILVSDTTDVGGRSEADFAVCCYAVENGVDRAEVWRLVQAVGKFAEGGEKYFARTWEAAEGRTREKILDKTTKKSKRKAGKKSDKKKEDHITNYDVIFVDNGEGKEKRETEPLPMSTVLDAIAFKTDKQPMRVGSTLFVDEPDKPQQDRVSWLEEQAALFGWLSRLYGIIEWKNGGGCVSRNEVFCEMRRTAPAFRAVETLPHEPRLDNHYYACSFPEPGDGKTLEKFLDFFTLESELDRQILLATMATPLWGGLPGSRPVILITAKTGRGKGKSTLAQLIALPFGGYVDVSAKEDITDVKKRFLNAEGLAIRVAMLDNIKTLRFSWAELESLITADIISGWRNYCGESQRPNYLTWFITLNGASLSTDLAQRVVEIRLGNPDYHGGWEERVKAFVVDHREDILGDLIAFLRRPPKPIDQPTRWATWEKHVLSKVDSPNKCLDVIQERRAEADVEQEESAVIEDYFANKLRRLGYDVERDDVFIPNDITARWYNRATGETRKVTGVTRTLKQLRDEERVWRLVHDRAGEAGERGFRWVGRRSDAEQPTKMDLRCRIAAKLADNQNPDF